MKKNIDIYYCNIIVAPKWLQYYIIYLRHIFLIPDFPSSVHLGGFCCYLEGIIEIE